MHIIHLYNDNLQLYHPVFQSGDGDEGVDEWPHDGPDDHPKTKESEHLTDKHEELTGQTTCSMLTLHVLCQFTLLHLVTFTKITFTLLRRYIDRRTNKHRKAKHWVDM